MPRLISARSDVTDSEMDKEALREFKELKEQYYLMENDRNDSTEKTQKILRKYRYEISILEAEREEINKELSLAECESNQRLDLKNAAILKNLSKTKDNIDLDIQKVREIINDLDQQLTDWMRKQKEWNQIYGSFGKNLKYSVAVEKTIRVMENRLDHTCKKFNHYLTENRHLRQKIDSLKAEKEKFDVIHQKLEKEYHHIRQNIIHLVEKSTQAYSYREDAQNRMVVIGEKSEKDIAQHHADMKELVRIIDHDRKLRDFMNLKSRERQEDSGTLAWRQKREVLEAERKKESQEDSVERYEAAVARIKAMTGEDNLDLDVPKFIEVEDKNFALFNYVNEMNSEIELLNDQTKEIQKDIENFQHEGAQLDFERKKILNELESLRLEVSKDISIKEESVKEISKIFDQIKTAIKSIFTVTQCDPAPIDDLLGLSAGINQTNMIQYLGVIEQRVNELLLIQMYLSSKNQLTNDPKFKESEESDPRNALGSISFLPPSIGEEYLGADENNDGEDELKPLTRSDLELQVLKSVKRREESSQGEDPKFEMMVNREKSLKSNQKKEFKKERI
ncbi:Hypothetical predicted protein [Octopus vulgaris]|uniref:ODAD1 central coiled coil region domain-containing protein n=1 Tax=Octopus vulgaris TaxID=6645 RepID=A0AA36BBH9_OCTVU|nr:Hypothetical predicted protein [Octopus vulgaris]